jgi:hypothetical protein
MEWKCDGTQAASRLTSGRAEVLQLSAKMETINVHNARSIALTIIFVIEDDPLLAAGLARVLNRRGNAVNRAAVGSRRQPDRHAGRSKNRIVVCGFSARPAGHPPCSTVLRCPATVVHRHDGHDAAARIELPA